MLNENDVDFNKVSHVLLSCGWIPVDKGSFDGKEVVIENLRCVMIVNDKKCTMFKSEGKLIICPFDEVKAIKFNK